MKRIKLTKGKFALVDDEDFEYLNQWKWTCVGRGYAQRKYSIKGGRKGINMYMHRDIVSIPKDKFIDHINGNGLDNRKSNLRICTLSQNNANRKKSINGTSMYKGVSWYSPYGKWCARICKNDLDIFIEYFKSEKEAALAYNEAAIKYHGEFANLNVIEPK